MSLAGRHDVGCADFELIAGSLLTSWPEGYLVLMLRIGAVGHNGIIRNV